MAVRRVKVRYRVKGSPIVHTREWGLTPTAVLHESDIHTILAAVHDCRPRDITLISATIYHKVESTPPL